MTSTPGSTCRGRSAHGALTDEGENAIHAAVEMIAALPRLGLDAHTHPLLGQSTAEVGAIRGGTEFNTVPDLCSFQLQTTIVPGQDGDATLASLEALAAEFGAGVEVVEMTEPFETPADSPLVVALAEATAAVAGEARDPIGVPAWTDAHNMVDFAGAEAVVYGPGDFATAHLPSEHIDVNEVVAVRGGVHGRRPAGGGLVTPASATTAAMASTAVSIWAGSSAAETWIRIRAVPSGTTG